jgi:hypothetical protein
MDTGKLWNPDFRRFRASYPEADRTLQKFEDELILRRQRDEDIDIQVPSLQNQHRILDPNSNVFNAKMQP